MHDDAGSDSSAASASSAPRAKKARGRRREPRIQRSLAIVLQALRSQRVTVDLKNDSTVTGVVDEADEDMALTLTEATLTSAAGEVKQMALTFVAGRAIRYVMIPDDVCVEQRLEAHMATVEKAQYKRPVLRPQR